MKLDLTPPADYTIVGVSRPKRNATTKMLSNRKRIKHQCPHNHYIQFVRMISNPLYIYTHTHTYTNTRANFLGCKCGKMMLWWILLCSIRGPLGFKTREGRSWGLRVETLNKGHTAWAAPLENRGWGWGWLWCLLKPCCPPLRPCGALYPIALLPHLFTLVLLSQLPI